MRALLAPGLVLLTACTSQPVVTNPFAKLADVAAQRQLETTILRDMDAESACVHVTGVLMDLECSISELNSDLGLVSATSTLRVIEPVNFIAASRWRQTCLGNAITVSVKETSGDSVAVRATFDHPDPDAEQTFRTLLRRSVTRQMEEAQ